MAPEEIAVVHRGLDARRAADRPRLSHLRHPGRGPSHDQGRPHRAGSRARRDGPLRAAGRERRRPAHLAAHARRAADARVRRPVGVRARVARARAPPPRLARSGSRSAGRWRRWTTWRSLRARRRQGAGRACRRRGRHAARRALAATAPVFDAEGELDARVAAQVRRALRELAQLPTELQPEPAALVATLDGLEVFVGSQSGAGRVTVTKPQSLRARRVRALFCLGLQEGVFPADQARAVPRRRRASRDQRRVGLAAAPARGRAERRAPVLLRRGLATDRAARAELARRGRRRGAVGPLAVRRRRRRPAHRRLGRAPAPSRARRRRLGGGRVRRADRARGRALQRRRRAARSAGAHRPPPRARGAGPAARAPHLVGLAVGGLGLVPGEVVRRAPPAPGGARARPRADDPRRAGPPRPGARALLARARWRPSPPSACPRRARSCARRSTSTATTSRSRPNPERLRSALRRLEVDLVRYIEFAAHAGSAFAPTRLRGQVRPGRGPASRRWSSTAARCGWPAGSTASTSTPSGREAIVYDYKGKTATAQAKWLEEGKLQIALYLLPCRMCSDSSRSAGSTSRSGGTEARPRGAVLEDADPGLQAFGTDRVDAEGLDALLARVRRRGARPRSPSIRAGRWSPRPSAAPTAAAARTPRSAAA